MPSTARSLLEVVLVVNAVVGVPMLVVKWLRLRRLVNELEVARPWMPARRRSGAVVIPLYPAVRREYSTNGRRPPA